MFVGVKKKDPMLMVAPKKVSLPFFDVILNDDICIHMGNVGFSSLT